MSNNKMKGLLKGLRYISQIFDNEKEPEMKIGYPTDVKHVAHIGWDGPSVDSVNSPSWINEYKSSPGFSSAPLSPIPHENIGENNVRRDTKAINSPVRDLPELPRSSRRQSSSSSAIGVVIKSPTREKSEKSKQSRRSSKSSIKDSLDSTKPARTTRQVPLDPNLGSVSPAHSLPDIIPKKGRRKKSKEYSHGTPLTRSSRLKPQASPGGILYNQSPFSVETYQSPFSDPGPGSGSYSTSKNNELYPQSFEEGQQKGYPGIY